MSNPTQNHERSSDPTSIARSDSNYTVVARRYRPKDFGELVGQSTIVQALTTAIETNRVGHAYLFTGARGVGKTSSARIFAKALNASADGKGSFDPNSDIAQAIDAGEDMDVLEIDGASNRGIDEIRQLRANVAIRPSRSPYKIYIIDEVHMLTGAAFNALLKTLEEPPAHVKFIFCTTDPEKLPITVLSRCQRFDFAPVKADQILARLRFICQSEGAAADEDALQLIARRAAGSMRDSQSLLEQILSFSAGTITVETVHAMLGTADESRLATIAQAMIARDASDVLSQLESALNEGVDAGQLGEQLLGYLRDMMVIGVGGSPELLRTANVARADELNKAAKEWGTMTLLSAIQLLDEALVKMKHSTQSRVLLEVAVTQICLLQDLQSLADVLRALQAGKSPPIVSKSDVSTLIRSEGSNSNATPKLPTSENVDLSEEKKKLEMNQALPAETSTSESLTSESLTSESLTNELSVRESLHDQLPSRETDSTEPSSSLPLVDEPPLETWLRCIKGLDGYVADCASMVVRIDASTNGSWVVAFPMGCEFAMEACNQPVNRIAIEAAIAAALGRSVKLQIQVSDKLLSQVKNVHPPQSPAVTQPHLIRKYSENDKVKSLLKSIDGQIVRVELDTKVNETNES